MHQRLHALVAWGARVDEVEGYYCVVQHAAAAVAAAIRDGASTQEKESQYHKVTKWKKIWPPAQYRWKWSLNAASSRGRSLRHTPTLPSIRKSNIQQALLHE
uniref:Uncharacterized protein n=1 Tax=Proboscia inermis TaxID=420281 RepID=A0A7S0GG56_9STRA|mmetsp:Transcript_37849/g.38207  ORF Transcript_37849/g.38207 Transcript_37849/m.38207 type:complete len:102 (+) Transcript_37849:223-528(+)